LRNEPPGVALTAPADGTAYYAPAAITLSATATDADGMVTKVEFYQGTTPPIRLGEASAPPFDFVWANIPPGAYFLTAKAYDNEGASSVSAGRSVTVEVGLPYFTSFEPSDGYTPGSLTDQAGWTVNGGLADVSNTIVYRGAQSLLLSPAQPPATATHTFPTHPGHEVIFIDIFAQPAAASDPTSSTFLHAESARVAFVSAGSHGELQVFDGDGAGGGVWRPTGLRLSLAGGRPLHWLRVTLREDFTAKRWDLYANGKMSWQPSRSLFSAA